MTVTVNYIIPAGVGGTAQGIGRIRHQERLTVPGTTSTPTQVGDVVVIVNGESTVVAAAWGSAPDADALDENGTVTTAGLAIPAGQPSIPMAPGGNKLINVKAVA